MLTALLLLSLRLAPYPGEVAQQLRQAAVGLENGRLPSAHDNLQYALTMEPGLEAVRELALRTALAAGRADEALIHLQTLESSGRAVPGADCVRLEAYLQLGEPARAADWLVRVEAPCPAAAAYLRSRADDSLASDDPDSALHALQQWVRLEPASAQAQASLGTLLSARDPRSALAPLRLALALDPQVDPQIPVLIRAIESSLAADDLPYSLAQVGLTLASSGRWDLSRYAFQAAVDGEPTFADAWAYLGLALDRSGGSGLSPLLRAIELQPNSALARFLLGKHWLTAGQPEAAITQLELSIRYNPRDPAVVADLGAAYSASGDVRSASSAYMRATELAPDEAAFWRLLASFSLENEIEVLSLGLPAARQAVWLEPANPASLDQLGYCYFLLGNFPLAERYLDRALRQEPGFASAHYHLGLLLLAQGDRQGGQGSLTSAMRLDPEGRIGALALRALSNLDG